MRWLAGTAGLLVVAACGSDALFPEDPSGCPQEVVPKINAMRDGSVAALELATRLRAEVVVVCANIATALGAPGAPDVSDPYALEDAEVLAACALAKQAIEDEAAQNGDVPVTFAGGYCRIDAAAQTACEAQLSNGSCEPGDAESRCAAGAFAGSCSASCNGDCVGTSSCAGSCSGICNGMCSGNCGISGPGACDSICTGTCDGQCEGECSANAPSAACPGVCLGECSAPFDDPSGCTEPLQPAPCTFDAGCAEVCSALGAFGADCVAPSAYVVGKDTFALTLKTNLPVLKRVAELEGPLQVDSFAAFVDALTVLPPDGVGNICADSFAQIAKRMTEASQALEVAISATAPVLEATNN